MVLLGRNSATIFLSAGSAPVLCRTRARLGGLQLCGGCAGSSSGSRRDCAVASSSVVLLPPTSMFPAVVLPSIGRREAYITTSAGSLTGFYAPALLISLPSVSSSSSSSTDPSFFSPPLFPPAVLTSTVLCCYLDVAAATSPSLPNQTPRLIRAAAADVNTWRHTHTHTTHTHPHHRHQWKLPAETSTSALVDQLGQDHIRAFDFIKATKSIFRKASLIYKLSR